MIKGIITLKRYLGELCHSFNIMLITMVRVVLVRVAVLGGWRVSGGVGEESVSGSAN